MTSLDDTASFLLHPQNKIGTSEAPMAERRDSAGGGECERHFICKGVEEGVMLGGTEHAVCPTG